MRKNYLHIVDKNNIHKKNYFFYELLNQLYFNNKSIDIHKVCYKKHTIINSYYSSPRIVLKKFKNSIYRFLINSQIIQFSIKREEQIRGFQTPAYRFKFLL